MTGTVAGCREKMYREQARLVCTKQAEYYSKMMGVTYGRIAIKKHQDALGKLQQFGKSEFPLEARSDASGDFRLCGCS